jgi:hypothetical protein
MQTTALYLQLEPGQKITIQNYSSVIGKDHLDLFTKTELEPYKAVIDLKRAKQVGMSQALEEFESQLAGA